MTSVFCNYRKPAAIMIAGQLPGFESGHLTRVLVVFDGRAFA